MAPDENSPRAAEGSESIRLAAERIAERRKQAASPRIYMGGSEPGGRSEDISPPSQG